MNDAATSICAALACMGIGYDFLAHDPVHAIEDCAAVGAALNAVVVKNYFLSTRNQKRFYLCIVPPNARFRSADISKQAGSSRLSFASEEWMRACLHTYSGAVSPLGLIFDSAHAVSLLADESLARLPRIAFHPCDNCCTLAFSGDDFFHRFLAETGHAPIWVTTHDFQ